MSDQSNPAQNLTSLIGQTMQQFSLKDSFLTLTLDRTMLVFCGENLEPQMSTPHRLKGSIITRAEILRQGEYIQGLLLQGTHPQYGVVRSLITFQDGQGDAHIGHLHVLNIQNS